MRLSFACSQIPEEQLGVPAPPSVKAKVNFEKILTLVRKSFLDTQSYNWRAEVLQQAEILSNI